MVPGDSWDFDSVQQLLLADLTIRGQQRKVLMQANKNGFYYVLDRLTGQFISGQPFAQVTWAKGLNEQTGRPIVNPEAHYSDDSVSISPGPGGAHNWSPMSFNPATGLIYIPTSTTGSFTYTLDKNFVYKPGQNNMGIIFGRGGPGGAAAPAAQSGTPAKAPVTPPAIGPTPLEGQRGALIAWDPVTQKERWRASGGGGIGGGTVTTAGNLVLQVIPDGRFVAYSADKGEKLFEFQTGLRGGMSPPITYQIDGKQYVTLMGGTGPIVFPGVPGGGGRGGAGRGGANAAPTPPAPAAGTPPAPAAGGGAGNDGNAPETAPPGFPGGPAPVLPKLLTFVLDGKAELPPAK
jgi:hypothetical protein